VRELRVALIGGGGFMGRAHSMAYALAPLLDAEARLVRHTLVDVSAELAERAADTYGWQHHSSDWEAVVASDEIDIVDIVTPPQFHLPIALAAIRAGKAVFCEKPLANSAADTLEMARVARESGVVTQVGFNYRHSPALTHLKELIDAGELGSMLQIRGSYLQDGHYFLGDFGWRSAKATGGSGAIGDIGSHVIDMTQYLAGPIRRVSARLASNAGEARTMWLPDSERIERDLVDDAGVWIAEFESGAIASFGVNFQSYGRKNQIRFELDGTLGAAAFDWNRREELRLALASDSATQSGFKTILVSEAHRDVWYPVAGIGMGYLESSAIQLARFARAVRGEAPASPDFTEAARVQAVVDAIHRSAESGAWVDVEEVAR